MGGITPVALKRSAAQSGLFLLRGPRRARRMDPLAARAHCDETRDALGARLGLLRGLHPVEDRVAVRPVEPREEGVSARVAGERRGKIRWHACGARAVIGALPAAVAPGALDLRKTGRLHRPGGDQAFRLRPIDLRPWAFCGTRREALQPGGFIERLLAAVDPAPRQCDVERLRVSDRLRARLADAQQHGLRTVMMCRQPDMPVRGARKRKDWLGGLLPGLHGTEFVTGLQERANWLGGEEKNPQNFSATGTGRGGGFPAHLAPP